MVVIHQSTINFDNDEDKDNSYREDNPGMTDYKRRKMRVLHHIMECKELLWIF